MHARCLHRLDRTATGAHTSSSLAVPPCSRRLQRVAQAHNAGNGRRGVILAASEQAAALIAEGKKKYDGGDKLAALAAYEKALKEYGKDMSPSQLQAAMYGQVAVHAAFGDVELAQMTLRDAVNAGLDFEMAQNDLDMPELQSSQQILIQLNKFNRNLLRQISERAEDRAAAAASGARAKQARQRAGQPSLTTVTSDQDLARILNGPPGGARKGNFGSDLQVEGIDASPVAIAKRVALLVLALSGLGVALFYLGLEYMFPKI